MARYLMEGTLSTQSLAALVKNPHDRGEALRPLFEKIGGKLEVYYFAVGQPKFYLICEFPDPVDPSTLASLGVVSMAHGAITSCSITQLLTSAEMIQGFKKAGEMGYHPPSS